MAQTTPFRQPLRPRFDALLELAVIALFGLLYCAAFLAGDGLVLYGLDAGNRIQGIEHERLSGILIPVEIGLGLSERAPGIGHVPAWNPYLGTGTPLLNNAFLYLYNPFMSLPVLLLGAVQGAKAALVINLLLAGLNVWALARAIGLGRLARVTTGVLYLLSGGILSRFYSGHFQLGLSLVWLPLVFAGLWWTLHTPDRRAPALMALAFALLFFSGNIYYTLHALVCCLVITIVCVAGGGLRPSSALRRVAVGGILALGLTMMQFLPVWLVRDYVSHERVVFDPATNQIASQYSLGQSLANLTLPWAGWKPLTNPPLSLIASVDYAYIGILPFLLILALIFTGTGRLRRIAAIALILAVLMMIWGAGQTVIVNELYRSIPLLAEFRYIGRAHAVAALWWIVLAGVALDQLWRRVRADDGGYDLARALRALLIALLLAAGLLWYSLSDNSTRLALALNNIHLFNTFNGWRLAHYAQAAGALVSISALVLALDTLLIPLDLRIRRVQSPALLRMLGARIVRVGLILLALAATADALSVNHALIEFGRPGNNFGSLYAATFGTGTDPATPFPSILEPHGPSTYDAYYSRVRTWGLDEGWKPRPLPNDLIPEGAPRLRSLPQWAIVSTEYERGGTYELARQFVEQQGGERIRCVNRNPQAADPCDIDSSDGSILYRIAAALPYAFVADIESLQSRAHTLTPETVQPVMAVDHRMDTITVTASAPGEGYYLIVQETHFPGWQAQIDGAAVETVTIGAQPPDGSVTGFIGVPMQSGVRTYTLRYDPPGYGLGAVISLLSLILLAGYIGGVRLTRLRRRL
jgi:hypothetical protein